MADIRIKVAKDKAKLVKALRAGEGSTGPFQTYVDILIFAAALGLKEKKFIPFKEYSIKDPDPIPGEHFLSRGASQIVDLIAITHTQNPKVLGEGNESERAAILEFYANGGLQLIEERSKGSGDYSGQLLLLVNSFRSQERDSSIFELDFLTEL
jgi:dnd system-associated protein 4